MTSSGDGSNQAKTGAAYGETRIYPPGAPEGFGPFAPNDQMSALLAQNWWAIALRGLAAILFGIVAVLMPGLTVAALVLLFAAYMVVDGVLALISAIRAARRHEKYGLLIFEGIADLVAGAIALVFPLATILAFVLLMGAWAIVSGALMLGAALRLTIAHGRWLMIFSSVVSIIWGFLLILWPLVGALVVTWWMGAYALIFGVTLLVLAFRLRSHRDDRLPSGTAAAHP
jgi:uncharacterized membrane protein HdeD (DUF308 family)